LLAFVQGDLAEEPQPELANVTACVVTFQWSANEMAQSLWSILRWAVVLYVFGLASNEARCDGRNCDLDFDFVRGEHFARPTDRGPQYVIEVDFVELVGGFRELLPGGPFGPFPQLVGRDDM